MSSQLRDSSILAIYESPNKYKQFKRLFQEIGIDATLCFTQGRVFDIPENEIGIDDNGDMKFVAVDEKRHNYIVNQIKSHDVVFCLTDMDDEGEWIADSVKRLSFEHADNTIFLRLNLKEITSNSLKKAIKNASEELDVDAISKAHARRFIDRYIGYTDNPKKLDVRGRILTPLLNSLYEKSMPQQHAYYVEHKDRVIAATSHLSAEEVSAAIKDAEVEICNSHEIQKSSIDTLPNTAECLLYQMSRIEDISATNAFQELQTLYQEGDISYPRTENSKYYVMEGQHSGIKAIDYDDDTEGEDSLLAFIKSRTLFANSRSTVTELVPSDEVVIALSSFGLSNIKIFKKDNSQQSAADSFYKPLARLNRRTTRTFFNDMKVTSINLSKYQLLLMRLAELDIAQPSTLHIHVDKAAKYTELNGELTLSPKGLRVALQSDPITNAIKNIENVHKINETLDKNGLKVEDKIAECLNIINQSVTSPEEKDLSL